MPRLNFAPICLYKITNLRSAEEVFDMGEFVSKVKWAFAVMEHGWPTVYACGSSTLPVIRKLLSPSMVVGRCNERSVRSARALGRIREVGTYVSVSAMRKARYRDVKDVGGREAWMHECCNCNCDVCLASLCGEYECKDGLCPSCPVKPYKAKDQISELERISRMPV